VSVLPARTHHAAARHSLDRTHTTIKQKSSERSGAAVTVPYQYDQSFWRSKTFLVGFAVRLALSKLAAPLPLLRQLFSPPIAFGVLEGLEYTDVWRRAQRTTRFLQCASVVVVFWLARLLWRLASLL